MHDIISLQLFYSLAFCELDQHLLGDVNLKILCESPESPVNGRMLEGVKCHSIKFEHFDRLFVVIRFFCIYNFFIKKSLFPAHVSILNV